jgi:hypothetical protein
VLFQKNNVVFFKPCLPLSAQRTPRLFEVNYKIFLCDLCVLCGENTIFNIRNGTSKFNNKGNHLTILKRTKSRKKGLPQRPKNRPSGCRKTMFVDETMPHQKRLPLGRTIYQQIAARATTPDYGLNRIRTASGYDLFTNQQMNDPRYFLGQASCRPNPVEPQLGVRARQPWPLQSFLTRDR